MLSKGLLANSYERSKNKKDWCYLNAGPSPLQVFFHLQIENRNGCR